MSTTGGQYAEFERRIAELSAAVEILTSKVEALRDGSDGLEPESPGLPQIVGEGGASVSRVGNTYRVWCPEVYGEQSVGGLWQIAQDVDERGRQTVSVSNCAVAVGGDYYLFDCSPLAVPQDTVDGEGGGESDGEEGAEEAPDNSWVLCCIFNMGRDHNLNFQFFFQKLDNLKGPGDGEYMKLVYEVSQAEYGIRIPVCLVEDGVVVAKLVDGVFCPFVYDYRYSADDDDVVIGGD